MTRIFALLVQVFMAVSVQAHPYHTSTMEVSQSQNGKLLHVALQMLPEDVEQLASELEGVHLTLLNQERVRYHMQRYLATHLLWQQGGTTLQTNGNMEMEWDSRSTWFYFTIPMFNQGPITLKNDLLFQLHPDALNIVVQLGPSERHANTLRFDDRVLVLNPKQLRRE